MEIAFSHKTHMEKIYKVTLTTSDNPIWIDRRLNYPNVAMSFKYFNAHLTWICLTSVKG